MALAWPRFRAVGRWRLRQAAYWLGLPGLVGVFLAATAVVFLVVAVLPAREEISHLKALAQELNAKASARNQQKPGPIDTPAQQLTRFFESFPGDDALPDALERVLATARKLNLTVQEGQYAIKHDPRSRLARYELSLPAKGDYERIRLFASRVLADVPHASLDSVALQRDKANQPEIEARLRFTVYFAAP